MRVVVRGGGGVAITLGGRLALTMAAAADVKVRVGVCVGDSSPAAVEEFGGRWGTGNGFVVRQVGEAAVVPPWPRVAGGG
jgi:hypothetical protein